MNPEHLFELFKYSTMAILGVFYAWEKLHPRIRMGRQSKELRRLEFISEFLAFRIENRHRLIVENAISFYFKRKLMYEEIQALMMFKNITLAFDLYKGCRRYVEVGESNVFSYKNNIKTPAQRMARKIVYLFLYAVFYIAAFAPVMWAINYNMVQTASSVVIVSIWCICFVVCAWAFIDEAVAILVSEKFIKQQEKSFNAY